VGNLLRNLVKGAGSIFEIMPAQRQHEQSVRLRTVEEALAEDWQRVGAHLRRAMAEGAAQMPGADPHDVESR
jgi:hypothetical protein